MKRLFCVVVAVACVPYGARADVALPMPPANRVALADAVIIGRIVALEDKDVEAVAPGGVKMTYRVAVVTITERLHGLKDTKSVRVGFVPIKAGIPIRRPGFSTPQLEVGGDGMFFLTKHQAESFYLTPMYFDFVARANPTFDKEAAEAREAGKLLSDPMTSLKAKDENDRFRAAALLIAKYRTPRGAMPKAEALGEEESKLILKALLDAKTWNTPQMFGRPHPWITFIQLGVTPKDGWTNPPGAKSVEETYAAARAWLERNWMTYRVQAFK